MANDSALTSTNIHHIGRSTRRDFVSLWAEDLFCIRKIMPFGRDENGTEGEGHANVVGAQDHIQDGNQLQLCASVLASRSAVVLGTMEMGVYNGRTTHNVRMLEQGYICVIDAEQSY